MKTCIFALLTTLILASCTSVPVTEYRGTYPPEHFKSDIPFESMYTLITDKMARCYTRSNLGGVAEGINATMNKEKKIGTVYYSVSGLSGQNILYLIDVIPEAQGSRVSLFAKGDLFRTNEELSGNLKKWIKNEKGSCRGHGEI